MIIGYDLTDFCGVMQLHARLLYKSKELEFPFLGDYKIKLYNGPSWALLQYKSQITLAQVGYYCNIHHKSQYGAINVKHPTKSL